MLALLLGEAFGGWLGGVAFEDEDFDGDVGVEADLGEEGSHLAVDDFLDGGDEAVLHRSLEGEACLADGSDFAGLDQRVFDWHEGVFEEADDVVVADDGADALGAATVVVALELGDRVRDRLRGAPALVGIA